MVKNILVVDDESDIRTTVKDILTKNGYKVTTANNGDDCIKKVKKNDFDLILMDIMMPGKPVREVISEIKDIKIAFLSVVRTSEAEKEILLKQKNIIDFIQKPFEVTDLEKRVKKILKE